MCIKQTYAPEFGHDLRHLRVASERRHVIDELGAELESAAGDLGLRCIDRDRRAVQRLEHRDDPPELFLGGDSVGARPRRLTADVDDRGAFIHHPPAGGRCGCGLKVDTAVGEGVGRHVDDSHHRRTRESFLD